MLINGFGDLDFTADELDALFEEEEQETPPAENNDASTAESTTDEQDQSKTNVETTKAFAKRLAEKSAKAVADEREAIAKKLGYQSYDDMMKQQENKTLTEKGLDPEVVSPVVDELVQKRIDNDPRMKELEELRSQKVKAFAEKELAEITQLTNGEITSLNQLSKEVVDVWKVTGSLKKAYLQVEGENLIAKARAEQSRGTTSHMNTPSSNNGSIPADQRLLTDKEKAAWRVFYPNITDEELNKKTVKK